MLLIIYLLKISDISYPTIGHLAPFGDTSNPPEEALLERIRKKQGTWWQCGLQHRELLWDRKKKPSETGPLFPLLMQKYMRTLKRKAACHLSHPRLLPQEASCWCIIFKAGKRGKKEFFLWAYRNQGHICLPLPFIWYCWLSLYNTRYDEGT